MSLDVQAFSKVICLWCYQRLERPPAASRHRDLRIRRYPFRFNPQMPREGMDRRDYRAAKFGSRERSLALDA